MGASNLGAGTLKLNIPGVLSSGGIVTQTGAITAGALDLSVGSAATGVNLVNLNNTGNAIGNFKVLTNSNNAGNVIFTDGTGFVLQGANVANGNLILTTTTGDMSQTGLINAGTLSVNTTTGNADFSTLNNNVATLIANAAATNTTNGIISFRDDNGFALATSNLGTLGTLNLTTNGALTQGAGNSVTANTLRLQLGSVSADLAQSTTNSVANLSANTTGGSVSYRNANNASLNLLASALGTGSLTLSLQGTSNLTQTGSLSGANLNLNVVNSQVDLSTGNNNFATFSANIPSGSTTTNSSVKYKDLDNIALSASNVGLTSGVLNIESVAGNITQSAGITGNSLIAKTNQANASIALANGSNNFSQLTINTNGGNAFYTNGNNNNLVLNASTLGTNNTAIFSLTTQGSGALSQAGGLTANQLLLSIGTGSADLSNPANAISNLSATGGAGANLNFRSDGGYNIQNVNLLSAANVGGNLTLTTGTGNVALALTSLNNITANQLTLNTTTGSISLVPNSGTNNINSLVVNAAYTNALGQVKYQDSDGFTLGTSSLSNVGEGLLYLGANSGTIDQSGSLSVGTLNTTIGGTGTFDFSRTLVGSTAIDNNVANFSGNTIDGTIKFTNGVNRNLSIQPNANNVASGSTNGTFSVATRGTGNISQQGAGIAPTQNLIITTGTGSADLSTQINDAVNLSFFSNNGSISFKDANGINITSGNVGTGNLTLIANAVSAGDITQTNQIIGGSLSLTTNGSNVILNNFSNSFGQLSASTNNGNLSYINNSTNNFLLHALNAGTGNITLVVQGLLAGGSVSQDGVVTANNLNITSTQTTDLSTQLNHIATLNAVSGASFRLYNSDFAVNSATVNATNGTLFLRSTGNITDNGVVSGNLLSLQTTSGNAYFDVIANNSFNQIDASTLSGNISYANIANKNLQVNSSNVGSGSLIVQTQGTGTMTGVGGVFGNTLVIKTGSGNATFTAPNNNISNLQVVSSGNVSYVDSNTYNVNSATTGGGNLSLQSIGGDITQSGLVSGNKLTLTTTAGNVDFASGGYANNFQSLSANSTSGNISYANGVNNLAVDTSALGTGDLALTSSGNITQVGDISGNNLTLTTNTGTASFLGFDNHFNALTANSTSGDILYQNSSGSLVINASNLGTGGLLVGINGAGQVTQSGAINANTLYVYGTSNLDSGANLSNAGNTINHFGAQTNGDVAFVNSHGFNVDTGILTGASSTLDLTALAGSITQNDPVMQLTGVQAANLILRTDTGNADFSNASLNNTVGQLSAYTNSGNIHYTNAANTDLYLNTSSIGTGSLTVTTQGNGNIMQSGAITGTPLTSQLSLNTDSGNAQLDFNGNNIATLSAHSNSGNISYFNNGNLVIGQSVLNGANSLLSLAVGGASTLTQTGTITTNQLQLSTGFGDATLTLGGNDVALFSAYSNNGNVSFADNNGYALAALLGTGNLNVSSTTGNITQFGNMIANNVTVATTGGNVDFTNPSNEINDINAATQGGNFALTNNNTFNVSQANLGTGSLTLTSTAGDISQTGAITASAFNLNTDAGNAIFNNPNNSTPSLVVNANSGTVSYTNGNNLNLLVSAAGNSNLSVITQGTGTINQNGAITAATLAVQTDSGNVTLINPLYFNAIGGFFASSTAGNVSFLNSLGYNILGANVGGDLSLATSFGNITQSGAINTNLLNVETDGGVIALSTQINNANNIALNTGTGANAYYLDADGFNILASNVATGDLTLQTLANNITQSGVLIGNQLNVQSGTGNVTLTNPANSFNALTALSSGGAVSYVNLANQNLSITGADLQNGSLSVRTQGTGSIAQTAGIIADTLNITTDSGDTDLGSFGSANNAIHNLAARSNSGNVTFFNSNTYNMLTSNVGSGSLVLHSAAGDITQTGELSGAALATATQGGDVLFGNMNNHFNTVSANSNSGSMSYRDDNGFDLAQSALNSGNMNLITNSGNITQSGDISGNTLAVTSEAGNVTLNSLNNSFNNFQAGANGADVIYTNLTDLNLLTSTVGNNGALRLRTLNSSNMNILGSAQGRVLEFVSGGSMALNANSLTAGEVIDFTAGQAITGNTLTSAPLLRAPTIQLSGAQVASQTAPINLYRFGLLANSVVNDASNQTGLGTTFGYNLITTRLILDSTGQYYEYPLISQPIPPVPPSPPTPIIPDNGGNNANNLNFDNALNQLTTTASQLNNPCTYSAGSLDGQDQALNIAGATGLCTGASPAGLTIDSAYKVYIYPALYKTTFGKLTFNTASR